MVARFVPDAFAPPSGFATTDLRLEPLGPEHNERDFAAWTSSIDHIRSTPGFPGPGDWPRPMSLDENRADLARHRDDFAARRGFTYTVLEPGTDEVIGCVYLYPCPDGEHDVHASSWVRASHAHLDARLWRLVSRWLVDAWPFGRIRYAPRDP